MPSSLSSLECQTTFKSATANADQPTGPFASPEDWRDLPIYFLMVDRFNNPKGPPNHLPFNNSDFADYQGGKFSGVQAQLPYIRQLGAGAIWLSPVLKNLPFEPTYHGYGIHDFLRAEPRFADQPANADDELRALVDAAHKQGLYVIFDIVLNHVGDVFAYQNGNSDFSPAARPIEWRDDSAKAQPGWTAIESIANPSANALVWPAELQQNQFFRRQGNPQPNGDDTVGDFDSLKQLYTLNADLQAFLIRAYQYVIARFDVDGFRIDTLRYLKGDLARLFGNSIREFALSIGKRNFFTFGEVLDGAAEADIARFIGRSTTDQSSLVGVDAALDYPLYNNLKPCMKGFSPPAAVAAMYQYRKQVEANILSSHGDATRFFVTFLDNHDNKERIRGDDPTYDAQVSLGLACLLALPGIPCIYYGTEQGLHGHGTDMAVREALWGGPGFSTGGPFYQAIKRITDTRKQQPALRYGRFYFRPVSGDGIQFSISPYPGGVLAFSRILNDQEVVIVANTSATQTQQSLYVIIENDLSTPNAAMKILYSNNANPAAPGNVEVKSNVTVQEVDGTIGTGPLHVVRVTLQPMEVQIARLL